MQYANTKLKAKDFKRGYLKCTSPQQHDNGTSSISTLSDGNAFLPLPTAPFCPWGPTDPGVPLSCFPHQAPVAPPASPRQLPTPLSLPLSPLGPPPKHWFTFSLSELMVMPILLNKNDSEMLYVNHTPNELSPLGRLVNSWTVLMAPNIVWLQTSTVAVRALKVKKKVDQSVSIHRENKHGLH